jgi:hypothetical protein
VSIGARDTVDLSHPYLLHPTRRSGRSAVWRPLTAGGTPAGERKVYRLSAATGLVAASTPSFPDKVPVGAAEATLAGQEEQFWILFNEGTILRLNKNLVAEQELHGPVVSANYRDIDIDKDGNIFVYVLLTKGHGMLAKRPVGSTNWCPSTQFKPTGALLPADARIAVCPSFGLVAVLDLDTKRDIYTYDNDLTPYAAKTLEMGYQTAYDLELLGGFAFISAKYRMVFGNQVQDYFYVDSVDTSTGKVRDTEALPGFALGLEPVSGDVGYLWSTGFKQHTDGKYYYLHRIKLEK